ncbi:hypothetical protein CWR48_06305 [Oceanobacillus arenosus]|uniref:Uncharacterized protein n=1 Tax=Oceanobacillus arenosus TaxID=1229153 RepID=A0A3D8PXM9_9BACI|nr:hypothetical protein [Oceanobacillus arenosus]RDW20297.1 hypothetical protein CWR48_06305 [Oceanobacillus arenosus]
MRSLEVIGDIVSYHSTYELSEQVDGTSLVNSVHIKPSKMNNILFNMMQRNIKSALSKNLKVLKRILEKEKVSYIAIGMI